MTEETTPKLYCYVHPDRETLLRCNRCERPICSQCAVLTPTGYRCKNCVHGQQKVFDTAQSTDFIAAAGIALVLSFLGSLIAGVMGFFTIFIAPIAGVIIAEAVRWALHRRRSRLLFQTAAGAAALGSLPLLVLALLPLLFGGGIGGILGLIYRGLYTILVTSSVYYRLGGVEIR
jgi:hypothetical protein